MRGGEEGKKEGVGDTTRGFLHYCRVVMGFNQLLETVLLIVVIVNGHS